MANFEFVGPSDMTGPAKKGIQGRTRVHMRMIYSSRRLNPGGVES